MSRRGEVGTAAVWLVLGAAVVVASWRMDRLRHLDVNPWSVPGLTPGAIGVLMMLFALVLGWRALRGGATHQAATASPDRTDGANGTGPVPSGAEHADSTDATGAAPVAGEARRTLVAGALCILFAGLTLGRGVPFVVEGAVFVFAFTSIFSWRAWRAEHRVARGLAQTAAVAILAAALISWLFESVFLVRLP